MSRHPIGSFPAIALALAWLSPPAQAGSDWEPVPPEDLTSTQATVEPGADAEVLFWKVWVDDERTYNELHSVREYYVRVKVFTPKGAEDWSQVHIPFVRHDVNLTNLRARTILPEGTVIPLERNAIVEETVVRRGGVQVRTRSFPMPSVQPGCIVEYRYRETRFDQAAHWESFNFQFEVPARKVVYYLKPLSIRGLYLRYMTFHVTATSSDRQVDGYFETQATHQAAFHAEPYMPPEWQQRAWMLLYYTDEKDTSPDRYWSKFGHAQAQAFDNLIRADDATRELARSIVEGAADDEERVRRLCIWCRRELRLLASSHPDSLKAARVRRNQNARDTLKRRAGTSWDVDMAFGALARASGLETRLLRVPSRAGMFFIRSMVSGRFLASYQIAIRWGGTWRSFDPQAREVSWDMLPWDEEGQFGLLCDRDSSRFIETSIAGPSQSRMGRAATLTLSEGGDLEGDIRLSFEGHCNEDLRSALADSAEGGLAAVLVDEGRLDEESGALLDARLVPGENTEAIAATCRVKLEDRATVAGHRLLLEPSVFHARSQPLFTATKRIHPVYFEHPWEERDTVRIHLPAGWKVEEAESPKPVQAPGVADYHAQIAVSDDGTELLYLRTLRVGENGVRFFPADAYDGVRRFFDLVHQSDQCAVTLVRNEGGR